MVSRVTGTNSVRDSRERKARYFMTERQAYMLEMLHHIARLSPSPQQAAQACRAA
jgi:hypothetical protein